MTSVLIVEDEESLADPLAFLLRKEGFEATVVADGPVGSAEFERAGADIVLLDLMLPGMSGTDVCKQLRSRSSVPVIMVTARDSEIDKVVGLELGADDYVTKPYSARELIARIRAVLRRGADDDDSGIDRRRARGGPGANGRRTAHRVSVNGEPITLPLKEFDLLEYLMRNSGRVLTRGQLIDRVWGADYVGDTKTLDVHVKRLRSQDRGRPGQPGAPRHGPRSWLQARGLSPPSYTLVLGAVVTISATSCRLSQSFVTVTFSVTSNDRSPSRAFAWRRVVSAGVRASDTGREARVASAVPCARELPCPADSCAHHTRGDVHRVRVLLVLTRTAGSSMRADPSAGPPSGSSWTKIRLSSKSLAMMVTF